MTDYSLQLVSILEEIIRSLKRNHVSDMIIANAVDSVISNMAGNDYDAVLEKLGRSFSESRVQNAPGTVYVL